MDWKATGQVHAVPAHDATNTNEVDGDLNAAEPGDAGIYVLRDFVASGDALRIKLPFIDPVNEFPEWIWVENHQGRNQNGNPFDRWLYEDNLCVIDLEPGLHMYMQIDKDVREAATAGEVYGGYASYLRPLVASGNHDRDSVSIIDPQGCVGWPPDYDPGWQRTAPNPFTGHADQNLFPLDKNGDNLLKAADHIPISIDYDGTFHENLFWGGHPRHGFRLGANPKLGVGTNPSSASQMSLVGYDQNIVTSRNLRRVYLNGLSIEVLEQLPDGAIKIQVRFDDVDVTNDARWCADEIQLNPVATSSGYSLNINSGSTITLDQGRTPTRRNSPIMLADGTKVFCSPTLMRCPVDTWLNMEPNSSFVVDNGSTLRLEAGSRLDVADGAVLRVKRGGTLELMGGSVLNVASGGLVVIEEDVVDGNDGKLVYHPDARINLDATTSELEIAGQLLIKENATFTTCRQADPNTTYGRVRFSNTDQPYSMNVSAEANTRFVLKGNTKNRKILYVEQESLYGPDALVEFTLRSGTAVLSNKSRIVPTVSNYCSVNFIDARVTSPTSERNTHRGVRLNGQGMLTLDGSTFSIGTYGIYSYNTVLGNVPDPNNCLFLNCDKGMYNYDKGILATDCSFNTCDDGLFCEQMSKPSVLEHCTAVNNQRYGVYFRGETKLRVTDPEFDRNDIGLALHETGAFVECGTVSENRTAGFTVNYGATLIMQNSDGTPHAPVTAIDNTITMLCKNASNCRLNVGHNSLRPAVTGQQNTLWGTFICQPYALYQDAYRNNWNGTVGTALTTAEYSITSCGSPLYFVDPESIAEVACGQAIPPCPDPPCDYPPDIFAYCPTCGDVETDEYGTVTLNVASAEARSVAEDDSLAGNEKAAIVGLNQILMNDIPDPSPDEIQLLQYDHDRLKESFSDGLAKGQLDPDDGTTETDDHLALVEEVQEKRIDDAEDAEYADFRFYTGLETAQMYRAAGKLEEAIAQMLLLQANAPESGQGLIDEITCLTQVELAVRNGTVHWNALDSAMATCLGASYRSLMATEEESSGELPEEPAVRMAPNPASDEATLSFMRPLDATGTLIVYNAVGAEVARWTIPSENSSLVIATAGLVPAMYHYKVFCGPQVLHDGKLAIVR